MKKAYITTLAILTTVGFAFSQQKEAVFKVQFSPKTKYEALMTSTSTSTIDFEADEETLKEVKASGITLPIIVKGEQKFTTTTETGAKDKNNTFPITTLYHIMAVSQSVNGEHRPTERSPLAGVKTLGRIMEGGKITIDSLAGRELSDEFKSQIMQMTEEMLGQVKFPDHPLKVGDKFTQETPLSIPIANFRTIEVMITTEYELKSMADKKALFDIIQKMTLSDKMEHGDIEATGSGTGAAVYNLNKNFLTSYNSDLIMDFAITTEQIKVLAKIETNTSQHTQISDRE